MSPYIEKERGYPSLSTGRTRIASAVGCADESLAAVTLARGGVPFALDQLPTGSFTGRLGQTGTAYIYAL